MLIVLEKRRAAELIIVNCESMVPLAPTEPVKITAPVVFTTRRESDPLAPSVVPVTVIAPLPAARVIDLLTPTRRFPPIVNAVLVVVMLEDVVTAPEVEKPPGDTMAPVDPLVNTPELVTATAPPAAAVKLLFTANVVPFNVAEPTATVFPKVVAPVAALV